MNPNRKTELLVGLFLLVGMVVLGIVILNFSSVRESLRERYELRVSFTNAPGLKAGSPVNLGGSRVGRVKGNPELKPDSSGVVVRLEIYTDTSVPLGSTFSVGSAGLMGDALVNIKIPDGKEFSEFYAHDFGEIIEGDEGGGLSALQSTAESAAQKVDRALDDFRVALQDVKEAMRKVNEDALSEKTLGNFEESFDHLKSTMQRVDEKLLADKNTTAFSEAMADIREAAGSFKTTSSNLESGSGKLDSALENIDVATAKLNQVLITADEALASIKSGADNVSVLAQELKTGDGLLAALMSDPELKKDFKDLIANLKSNGVLFYRDSAGRAEGGESANPPSRSSASPRPKHGPFKR